MVSSLTAKEDPMKHLPWLLLAAVLAYPLFAQGTLGSVSLLRQPLKILGQPALSEWVDIPLDDGNLQYIVPAGKALMMYGTTRRVEGLGGSIQTQINVDGVGMVVTSVAEEGDLYRLYGYPEAIVVAREGQVITAMRLAGDAPANTIFYLRSWLEDIK